MPHAQVPADLGEHRFAKVSFGQIAFMLLLGVLFAVPARAQSDEKAKRCAAMEKAAEEARQKKNPTAKDMVAALRPTECDVPDQNVTERVEKFKSDYNKWSNCMGAGGKNCGRPPEYD